MAMHNVCDFQLPRSSRTQAIVLTSPGGVFELGDLNNRSW